MERASRNIKNGASMAGSFVGQRGPREQMRIGEEKDVGRKKGDEERRERERETVQESETQYLLPSSPPPLFCFRCTKLRSSFDSFPQGKLGAALG